MMDNDAPFANIADPPSDVDFLGELTYLPHGDRAPPGLSFVVTGVTELSPKIT